MSETFALAADANGVALPSVLVALPSPAPDRTPGTFPLIVISHGNGGAGLLYRSLGEFLAQHGYVVMMPDHPGNTRTDNGRARTLANLEDRPEHVRRAIDWAYGESAFAASLRPGTVAVIGHSMGGYTALALAGGRPTAFGAETPDGQARTVDVVPDERVRAIVLLAPATAWFEAPGALDGVRVPVLLITAEHDAYTPPFHAEIVTRGVAGVEHTIVANAGHFSFLDPFPATLTKPEFAPSQDPPGFDREAYHETLNADVLAFLQRVLSPGNTCR